MEPQKNLNKQSNIEEEKQTGGTMILDLKLYYKALVIKAAWYWHKNRHTDQWNIIESPEMDPQIQGQLIFNKAGKNNK